MTKYRAKRVIDPIHGAFDSQAEHKRWYFLLRMQSLGEITHLERQRTYKMEVNGKLICRYRSDFEYQLKDGTWVTEDLKGVLTPVFKLKAKMFEALFGKKIFIAKAPNAWHN